MHAAAKAPVSKPAKTAPSSSDVLAYSDSVLLPPGEYHFKDVRDIDRLLEDNHRIVDETDKEFARLRDSILLNGIKEEIHLYLDRDNDGRAHLAIVAGHRRTRVVRSLRAIGNFNVTLPAKLVVPQPGEARPAVIDRYVTAAVTNLVRQNLRGVERARAIQNLLKSGMRVDQVTLTLGVNRKVVERSQNLLTLPKEAQEFIDANLHNLRENRLFAIAQQYKNLSTQAKSGDKAEAELMEALKDEAGPRLMAGSASGGRPRRSVVEKDQSTVSIDPEMLKAKLMVAKMPQNWIKVVMAALADGV